LRILHTPDECIVRTALAAIGVELAPTQTLIMPRC